jgi:hypothetical protein
MNIAFSVIATGATVWAASVLGVLVLGIAARRNDPRVVVDDPWERPEIAARWEERAHPDGPDDLDDIADSVDPAAGRPPRAGDPASRRSNPRSAA